MIPKQCVSSCGGIMLCFFLIVVRCDVNNVHNAEFDDDDDDDGNDDDNDIVVFVRKMKKKTVLNFLNYIVSNINDDCVGCSSTKHKGLLSVTVSGLSSQQ